MSGVCEWAVHQAVCARCRDVSLDRPASLAQACLEGSVLAKNAAASQAADERRRAREEARQLPARNELERESGRRA